jgi:ubiquinone/menaquinone biosynthesis C-methylase UbiE
MYRIRDPEEVEAKHLIRAGQFSGKMVLEIGCGFGWLTWQFAERATKLVGIDPSLADLRQAKNDQSVLVTNVSIAQADGVSLPFPSSSFDTALFSSSL